MKKAMILAVMMLGIASVGWADFELRTEPWQPPRLVDGVWVTSGVSDEKAKEYAAEWKVAREAIMAQRTVEPSQGPSFVLGDWAPILSSLEGHEERMRHAEEASRAGRQVEFYNWLDRAFPEPPYSTAPLGPGLGDAINRITGRGLQRGIGPPRYTY